VALQAPALSRWETPYWEAYHTVSRGRSFTMGGVGPIPLSEIHSFFLLMGIHDPDERDDYLYHIVALDGVYLEHMSKKD